MFKRKRGRRRKQRVLGLLSGVAVAIVSTVFVFFWFDQLPLYYTMLFARQAERDAANSQGSTDIINGSSWDELPDLNGDGGTGSDGSSNLIGAAGLRALYVNSMSAGYYKEYLSIIKSHVDGTNMHPDVAPVMVNGEKYQQTISNVLGMMLSEGALESYAGDSTRVSPPTTLSRLSYNTADNMHSLGTYNSAVASADNGSTLHPNYNGSLDLYWMGETTVRSNFQFTDDQAAIYPSGRLHSKANKYPSLMNGYGVTANTVRGLEDTDAAYFPDQLSIMLQRSWHSLSESSVYLDISELTERELWLAAYRAYNSGETALMYAWGLGIPYRTAGASIFCRDDWSSQNSVTPAQCTASSIKIVSDVVEKLLDGLCSDYSTVTRGLWTGTGAYAYAYANHSDYEGMIVTAMLLSGGQTNAANKTALLQSLEETGFGRGATLAYRILKEDVDATVDTVKSWVSNLPTREVPSEYGNVVDAAVYWYDSDCMIYGSDGSGPYTALHAYTGVTLRGGIMTRIGGTMVYWKMLTQGGVECTLEDAYRDTLGVAVEMGANLSGKPADNVSADYVRDAQGNLVDDPNGSYYYGTRTFKSVLSGSSALPRKTSDLKYRNITNSVGIHYGEDYGVYRCLMAAIADGTVAITDKANYRGNHMKVWVKAPDWSDEPPMSYWLLHLESFKASVGQRVKEGDIIAVSGNSGGVGFAYSYHLHFELRVHGNDSIDADGFCVSYSDCFNGVITPCYAPRVPYGAKSLPGDVYDKNYRKLGTLTTQSVLDSGKGIHYFNDLARTAT